MDIIPNVMLFFFEIEKFLFINLLNIKYTNHFRNLHISIILIKKTILIVAFIAKKKQ
jgi:hypothetical protein